MCIYHTNNDVFLYSWSPFGADLKDSQCILRFYLFSMILLCFLIPTEPTGSASVRFGFGSARFRFGSASVRAGFGSAWAFLGYSGPVLRFNGVLRGLFGELWFYKVFWFPLLDGGGGSFTTNAQMIFSQNPNSRSKLSEKYGGRNDLKIEFVF